MFPVFFLIHGNNIKISQMTKRFKNSVAVLEAIHFLLEVSVHTQNSSKFNIHFKLQPSSSLL